MSCYRTTGRRLARCDRRTVTQELLNGTNTGLGAGAVLSNRQARLQAQAKDFSDFSHWCSLGWHDAAPQKGSTVANSRTNNALRRFPAEREHLFREDEHPFRDGEQRFRKIQKSVHLQPE
jgi:hypothetical protein